MNLSENSQQELPVGVHIVGSVPLPTTSDVFSRLPDALPKRLLRIPDGEPAGRLSFNTFQRNILSSVVPQAVLEIGPNGVRPQPHPPTPADLSVVSSALTSNPLQTQYDKHALESYKIFTRMRPYPSMKFQVALPTPVNSMAWVAQGYRTTVEPFYEDALICAVKNIEGSIPHDDLAIQWDCPVDFAMLEEVPNPLFTPYFSPVEEGVIERMVRMVDAVAPDVECGFHFCYGDIWHKHFIEPKDMGRMVEVAKAILQRSKRQIAYIHMPVPKERTDDGYFAPLKELDLGTTQLYLGLVHYDDLQGTKERIAAASKTGKKFGVATECGMGRTPPEQLDSILQISAMVSRPYTVL